MGRDVSYTAPDSSTGPAPRETDPSVGAGFTGTSERVQASDPLATDKKIHGIEQKDEDVVQRPEFIPEKFWTGEINESMQKMAASYAELEKAFSSREKPETKPEPIPEKTEEIPNDTSIGLESLFAEAASEYTERGGSLSPETYDRFAKAGITPRMVNQYIEGQAASSERRASRLFDLAGGEEALQSALSWAADGYTEAEIQEFNKAVDGESTASADNAVRLLMMRYRDATGTPSGLVSGFEQAGSRTQGAIQPFGSMMEQRKAQADPRYVTDPAYTNMVMARIKASIDRGGYR